MGKDVLGDKSPVTPDEEIRAFLIAARQRLVEDQRRYVDYVEDQSWRVEVRSRVDSEIAQARAMITLHQAKMGLTVTIFEKTRITRLNETCEKLLCTAPIQPAPKQKRVRGPKPTPKQRKNAREEHSRYMATKGCNRVPAEIGKRKPFSFSADDVSSRSRKAASPSITLAMLGPKALRSREIGGLRWALRARLGRGR